MSDRRAPDAIGDAGAKNAEGERFDGISCDDGVYP
jgi:hypothetical protein